MGKSSFKWLFGLLLVISIVACKVVCKVDKLKNREIITYTQVRHQLNQVILKDSSLVKLLDDFVNQEKKIPKVKVFDSPLYFIDIFPYDNDIKIEITATNLYPEILSSDTLSSDILGLPSNYIAINKYGVLSFKSTLFLVQQFYYYNTSECIRCSNFLYRNFTFLDDTTSVNSLKFYSDVVSKSNEIPPYKIPKWFYSHRYTLINDSLELETKEYRPPIPIILR
jgi:hypothetical protein